MTSETVKRLAEVLLAARQPGGQLTSLPEALVPATEAEADAVQWRVAEALGPLAAYKVMPKGGAWGAILAPDVADASQPYPVVDQPIKAEVEIGFQIGTDLTALPPSGAFTRADLEAALAGAFVAAEIVGTRFIPTLTVPPLFARADRLANYGLVYGETRADWRAFAEPRLYRPTLTTGGVVRVEGEHTHPSGVDPLAPILWLANHLAAAGRGLRAGDRVITGAFGGAQPAAIGDLVVADVEGLGRLAFTLVAA